MNHAVSIPIVGSPDAQAEGDLTSTNLKEFIMNEALELELVDLGDAKEATKGAKSGPQTEDDQALPRREF